MTDDEKMLDRDALLYGECYWHVVEGKRVRIDPATVQFRRHGKDMTLKDRMEKLRRRDPLFTVAKLVEVTLYGDCEERDEDFLSVATEVLKVPQAEVDEAMALTGEAVEPELASYASQTDDESPETAMLPEPSQIPPMPDVEQLVKDQFVKDVNLDKHHMNQNVSPSLLPGNDVLDHGYVRFVEAWGTGADGSWTSKQNGYGSPDYEVGIVEAARQSTQGSFRGWEQDAKLLRFLYEHRHNTPFEFAGMTLEIQAPIFVFREWHRHRTQSYNEMSARYAPLPDLYYVPSVDRCVVLETKNKQAAAMGTLVANPNDVEHWKQDVIGFYALAEKLYQRGLKMGIPKEVARVVNPVGHYSRMRVSANLRNWISFLTLRMDPNAQWEIRQFANAVGDIVSGVFPQTWALFCEGNVLNLRLPK